MEIYQNIKNAIFIIGCDRSGTTFLGSVIGSHSKCIATPESQFKVDCYSEQDKTSFNAEEAFTKIQNTIRFKNWNTDISFTKSEYNEIKNYPDLILNIVQKYNISKRHKTTANIWVDHTPINVEYVDFLKQLYPNAKFLHIIRDGRAVASSFKNLPWGPKSVQDIAKFWLKKLAFGFAYEIKYPKDILSIKYESLLNDTEATVKQITDFIGIGYEKNMLEANGMIVPEYTKYQHELVGTKANKARINAWEQTLSRREIELFEYETKNMLNLLGYDKFFKDAKKEKIYERIPFIIKYRYIRSMNKWKKRLRR